MPQLGQYRRPYRLASSPGRNASQRLAKVSDLIPDKPALLGVDHQDRS
jgi:hypothetical protein